MTVKELIKELQKWEPDDEVRIENNQWAQPIKKVTRTVYYTDSDGEWYSCDRDADEGLIKRRAVVLLSRQ